MLTLLLLSLALDGPAYHIKDTNIFQALDKKETYVAPSGEVYLLNFEEARIQRYGVDGKLKQSIGRKGKGPGEFTFPAFFSVADGKISIFDILSTQVSVFDMEGKFLGRFEMPARNMTMVRGSKGWIFWKAPDFQNAGGPSALEWADPMMKNNRILQKIPATGRGMGTWFWTDNGKSTASYSPLSTEPQLTVSPDGSRIYYADRLAFKIAIYDGTTGKLRHTLTRDEKPIPFDKDWADEQYETSTEDMRKSNPGVKVQKIFPEFFPSIRELTFDPDGQLVVDRWRGRPGNNHHLVSYDAAGKEVPTKYSYEALRRYVGQAKGMAYVIMFETDEEAGLCKVPLKELEAFVKKYPVTDWGRSRSISISD